MHCPRQDATLPVSECARPGASWPSWRGVRPLEAPGFRRGEMSLRQILVHMDCLEAAIAQLEGEIEQRLQPYEEALHLLQTIPGGKAVAAATVVAELGLDMQQFPPPSTLPPGRQSVRSASRAAANA